MGWNDWLISRLGMDALIRCLTTVLVTLIDWMFIIGKFKWLTHLSTKKVNFKVLNKSTCTNNWLLLWLETQSND